MSLRESTNYAVVQVNIGLESIDSGAMTINSGYKIAGMAVWGLELMNFKKAISVLSCGKFFVGTGQNEARNCR